MEVIVHLPHRIAVRIESQSPVQLKTMVVLLLLLLVIVVVLLLLQDLQ